MYYFGTNLGASIEAGDDGGIELVRGILKGVLQPASHRGQGAAKTD